MSLPAGVMDELELQPAASVMDEIELTFNSSMTPASSDIVENYQML
jgi:hypothetical protein